jgi:hypothetical protein
MNHLMDEVDQMLTSLDELRRKCSKVVGSKLSYLEGGGSGGPDYDFESVLDALNAAGKIKPINTGSRKVAALLENWAFDFENEYENVWEESGLGHPLRDKLEQIARLSNENEPSEVDEFELPPMSRAMLGRLPTLPKMQDLFVVYNEAVNSGKHKRVKDPYEACIDGILDCIQAFLDQGNGSGALTKSANKT